MAVSGISSNISMSTTNPRSRFFFSMLEAMTSVSYLCGLQEAFAIVDNGGLAHRSSILRLVRPRFRFPLPSKSQAMLFLSTNIVRLQPNDGRCA